MEQSYFIERLDKLIELKRYKDATQESSSFIARFPENFIGFYYKGLSEFCLGESELAEASVRASLAIEPSSIEVRSLLARIKLFQEDYAEAIRIAKEVLGTDPNNLDAHILMAMSYMDLEKYDKAEASIRKGLFISPTSSTMLYWDAYLKYLQHDMKGAEKSARLSLQKSPDDVDALEILAKIKMEQKDFASAEKILYSAIIKDPGNEEMKMALIECKKGRSWLFRIFYNYGFSRWTYELTLGSVIWLIIGLKGVLIFSFFFVLFLLFTWYGDVLYNSFLRLGKLDKYLLSKLKIKQSNFFIISNAIVTVLGILAYIFQIKLLWQLMVLAIFLLLTGISFFEITTKKGKISAAITIAIMLACLVCTLISFPNISSLAFIAILLLSVYGFLFSLRLVGK